MKLKRFLAAALAGVMAITSSVVTSVTASAETIETTLGTFFTGEAVLSGASYNSHWVQLSDEGQSWTWEEVLENENVYLKVVYSMDATGADNHNNAFTWGGLEGGWYTGDIKAYTSDSIPMYYDGTDVVADTDYTAYLLFSKLLLSASNVDEWGQLGFNMQANTSGEWTLKSVLLVKITETYAITTTTPTNGTLSVDKTGAAEGETVTVTANPATGYELEAITVNGTAITGTTFEMPAEAVTVAATFKAAETEEPEEDVLESGTYTDGTWEQLSADEIAALGNLNTNTIVGDEYLTTQNVLSVQYSASEKKFRIYQLYSEKDLADKSSASIVVKKGDVALRLTTECVYTTIADGQTAPDGSYYIAWVISGVEDPTAFSYSGITLA